MPFQNIAATTRELLRQALADMGETLPRKALDRLVQIVISIWSGDETPDLVKDPTANEAIRRVLAQINDAEEATA